MLKIKEDGFVIFRVNVLLNYSNWFSNRHKLKWEVKENSKNFISFSCYIFINFINILKNIINYHIQEKWKIFFFFWILLILVLILL